MKNLIKAFSSHRALFCLSVVAVMLTTNVADAQKVNMNGTTLSALQTNSATLSNKQKSDIEDLLNYYGKQIYFTENKGQWTSDVLYRADFPLGQALVTGKGMLIGTLDPTDMEARRSRGFREEEAMHRGMSFNEPEVSVKGHGWLMNFVNSSPAMTIEAKSKHSDAFNYFNQTASGRSASADNYKEIWYNNVYNNVDVRYYPSEQGTLEYDIVAKPGFNKNNIAIRFDGIDKMVVNANGHLVLKTSVGDVDFPAPVAYQKVNGKRVSVNVKYVVVANTLKFELGNYVTTLPLIIDPIALRWATWINSNSTGDNHGHGIWVDPSDGAIYVVARVDGSTDQITAGAFQTTAKGGIDLVVGKYNEPATVGGAGSRVWQTYIGGSSDDNPYAMEQGPDGNLYITGYTASTNYPLSGGTAFSGGGASIDQRAQTTHNIFVTKITKDGASIKSSVIGGNGDDNSFDLRINPAGDVIVCGNTKSTNLSTLYSGKGASNTNNGNIDVLVFKINSDLSAISWMKNYGGSGADLATIMLTNPVSGDIFVGGYTSSTNFPTANPRQSTKGGTTDGFLQKLNSSGSTIWSSYFQSAASDSTLLLCMEFNTTKDKIYFGGITYGLNSSNISASGVYQKTIKGSADYFVALMDTNQTFRAATYVGGTGREGNMMGLNVDLNNDVYVFGYSRSTDFPVTADALQSGNLGTNDKNFFKLSSDLSTLKFSTYYGGAADDYDPVGERGIKFSNCRIYTIVTARSNNIPLTQGAVTTSKSSSTSVYEPGLVVWANPPDLANNSVTSNQVICPGTTPIDLTGSVPSYSLPTISRNGTNSAYPVSLNSATTYQWQTSTDSINWNNIAGGNTQNLTGSLVGSIFQKTYIRRIIGGDACVIAGAANQIITIKTITLASTVVSNNICGTDKNGSIAVTVTDGTAPYTYHWSNGATTSTISSLVPGSYTVTVNDNGGCSRTGTYTITGATAIVASTTPTATTCGISNGAETLSVSGGTSPYSYAWSNSSTTKNISGLAANTYNVTITDALGCTASASANVGASAPPVVSVSGATFCNGNSALLTAGGASTYKWAPNTNLSASAGTSITANPSVTTTYTVTGTDAIGCTAAATSVVTVNALPSANITGASTICSYGNATLQANASAGSGSITSYQWQLNSSNISGATAASYNTSAAGSYSVIITNSNGCTASAASSFTITKASALAIQSSLTNANCSGEHNGAVDITVTGSVPGYTYNWTNGSTTQDLSGIAAGNYAVTVTDSHGCTAASQSFTIAQPAVLAIDANSVVTENANCNGEKNGSINITVNGGSPAYTYNWSNGATSQDVSALGAGTYSVTVTDTHSCSLISQSFTISEPAKLVIDANAVVVANANCNGEKNGSINLIVNGGSLPYTYIWSNGATAEDISGLGAGSYSVTIADAHGCSVSHSYTITQPAVLAIDANAVVVADANCNGEKNGSINLTVNGGSLPYTYSWSNSATTEDISGLGAGSYSVTIADAHGCSVSHSYTIAQPTVLAIDANAVVVSDANCNGEKNGSINVTVTGGSVPYTYNWSNGASSEDISGLGAGTYSVTIADAHGCSVSHSYTVSQPSVLSVDANGVVISDAACNGAQNGSISITVNGGVPAYTFSWSNGATTQNIASLVAGNYSVTITDAHGCSLSKSYTVSQPSTLAIDANAVVVSDANCNGEENGSVNLTISGGLLPYTYSWNNNATSEDISGLGAGNYSVTITDAHGCAVSQSYTISEPTVLAINANAVVVADANCNGEKNGSVNLTVTGGSLPYTYNWSNGATTEDISGLGAGTYSVTIADAHGCSVSHSYTITQPEVLSIDANAVVVADANCNGEKNGSINVTLTGGSLPYAYNWSNGATSEDISGLGAGSYSVTIADAHGCSVSHSYTITQPEVLSIDANAVVVADANCNGEKNGSINLTVNGGSLPYSYNWSNGATTEDISDLGAGSYSVIIADAHGCSVSHSYTITQPEVLSIDANAVVVADANCNGEKNGSINVTVNGGSLPYSYNWSNGATTEDISGLGAGSYSVTIADAHGCSVSHSYTIAQPEVLSIDANGVVVAAANCKDEKNGSINITVIGGSLPYTYNWSNSATTEDISGLGAGSYAVTIADAHGCSVSHSYTIAEPTKLSIDANGVVISDAACNGAKNGSISIVVAGGSPAYTFNWSNGATTQNISSLIAGDFGVTIADTHGCSVSQSFTVSQPSTLAIDDNAVVVAAANCNGEKNGSVNITVNGGLVPYTYNWSNEATTEDIAGLGAGNYSVTIADAHGCAVSHSYTIAEPTILKIDASGVVVADANCNGDKNGSVTLSVNGGSPGYTYNWDNGASTQNISGLGAGSYAVTIADAHGCSVSQSYTIAEPTLLKIDASAVVVADANCNSDKNGSVVLSVNGGSPTYTYNWDNGASTQNIAGLGAGSYAVTIADAHGCSVSQSYTIAEPVQLSVDGVSTDAKCNSGKDGSIALTTNGGTLPYSFDWSNAGAGSGITDLGADIYTVTVTDAHNCTVSKSFTVNQPAQLTIEGTVTDANCHGDNNGSINLSVNGGVAEYTYNWNNDEATGNVSGLTASDYSVTVTDSHGCVVSQSYTVNQPAVLSVSGLAADANCNGDQNGSVNIVVNGGSSDDYTYNWSNEATTQNVSGLNANSYSVTVTDSHTCTVSQSFTVNEPTQLTVDGSSADANCNADLNGSVDITANGGSNGYTYNWSNGASTEDLSAVGANLYTVTVSDAHSCSVTKSFTVNEPAQLTVDGTATDAKCNADKNGSIDIAAAGGTGSYTYSWSNGASTEDLSAVGANLYTVTVSDAHSCSVNKSFSVEQPSLLTVDGTAKQANCNGDHDGAVNITVDGGNSGYSYNWDNGSTTQNITDVAAGTYEVTVTDAKGCSASDRVEVTYPKAQSNAGADIKVDCDNGSAQLDAQGQGIWTIISGQGSLSSATDSAAILSNVPKNVSVVLVWTVTNGACSNSDTVNADACKDTTLFIPTGFSPNSDGVNDNFVIKGISKYPNNNLTIFNRWGNAVYAKDNYSNQWGGGNMGGEPLPDATYFVIFTSPDNGGIKYGGYVDLRRQ